MPHTRHSMTRTTLKLSEMADDIEISIEESSEVLTVGDLKRDILKFHEPDHEYDNWYTIKRKKWQPNAASMVGAYIDQEYGDMYEDWDDRAMECLTNSVMDQLQEVLDNAFSTDHATAYWSYENPVDIDIVPPKRN